MRAPLLLVLATVVPAAASTAVAQRPAESDADRIILAAIAVSGGEQALRGLHVTRADLTWLTLGIGQEQTPGGLPPLRVITGELLQDFSRERRAIVGEQRHRQHRFVYRTIVTPTAALTQSWGYDAARMGQSGVAEQRQALRFSPERILLAALESRCAVVPTERMSIETSLACATGDSTFTLRFDRRSRRLLAHEVSSLNPQGHRSITATRYDDHRGVIGSTAIVPHLMQVERDGQVTDVVQLGRVEVLNQVPESLFVLESAFNTPPPGPAAPISVTLRQLSPSMYHVASVPYYSLAVLQGDSLVLADAPESTARTQAILDTLRARFPGNPVRLALVSHHHFDHVDGLDALVRAGIPVLTNELNASVLRGIESRLHSGVSRVRGIRDSVTIGTGESALRLYPVWNPHAAGTLLVYQPSSRLLFAADLAENGAWQVEREGLVRNIEQLGISVDRVAPGHAAVRTWNEFLGMVRRSSSLRGDSAAVAMARRSLLLRGATVIDATGSPPQPNRTIVLRDGRIAAIGGPELQVPAGARVVDVTGKFVIPGLCDAHAHFRYGEPSLGRFLANGVTCLREMWGDAAEVASWRARIDSGALVGPRILDVSWGFPDGERQLAAEAIVDSASRAGATFIKLGDQIPRATFDRLLAAVRTRGLAALGHLPYSVSAIDAANMGQLSIEHANRLLFDVAVGGDSLREQMARVSSRDARYAVLGSVVARYDSARADMLARTLGHTPVMLSPTLISARRLAFRNDSIFDADQRLRHMPDSLRSQWRRTVVEGRLSEAQRDIARAMYARQLDLVRVMHRNGVPLLAGSDAGDTYVYDGSSLHDEMVELARAGVPAMAVLQAATINVARISDMLDRLGSVTVGKDADLVILDANPLADITNVRRIHAVVRGGRLLERRELDAMLR